MKKEDIYSYKPWLILSFFVLSLVLISFSSVNAADPDLEGYVFDPWSSRGYLAVTVELPYSDHNAARKIQQSF